MATVIHQNREDMCSAQVDTDRQRDRARALHARSGILRCAKIKWEVGTPKAGVIMLNCAYAKAIDFCDHVLKTLQCLLRCERRTVAPFGGVTLRGGAFSVSSVWVSSGAEPPRSEVTAVHTELQSRRGFHTDPSQSPTPSDPAPLSLDPPLPTSPYH